LDISDIGLAVLIPWEPMDHYSRVAAKHLVGADLLPPSNRSTRVRCRALERIEGGILFIDVGASDGDLCCARRRTRPLNYMCKSWLTRLPDM
jgi:hypothetical protein